MSVMNPAPTPEATPCLLCRILGHHWTVKNVDEESRPGYRLVKRVFLTYCLRCGKRNPVYDADADQPNQTTP